MAFYMIVEDFENGSGAKLITDITQAPEEVIEDGVVARDEEARAEYIRRINANEWGMED